MGQTTYFIQDPSIRHPNVYLKAAGWEAFWTEDLTSGQRLYSSPMAFS